MPFPTLDLLRQQCRLDSDNPADDDLLNTYSRAAIKRAESYLNRRLYENAIPEDDPNGLLVTDDVALAIMLTVGFWYDSRDGQSLPLGFQVLLEPYRFIPL
ncbi:head-tail connector protein [Xenorhabdus stockiae]|uniref:head-tail connector protein n=1 Tax=Xenorhabdus stockiae TaxID=351614 RepID=UPI003CF3D331